MGRLALVPDPTSETPSGALPFGMRGDRTFSIRSCGMLPDLSLFFTMIGLFFCTWRV